MKNELIEKFKTLLQNEDITAIKQEVRQVRANYKAESAKERQLQLEKWNEAEHEEGEEFIPVDSELDEGFGELIGQYTERVKAHGQKIAEEQKANLSTKKMLMIRMKDLVQNEENIGKAFHDFNTILEEWKSTGDVPGDQYEKVNSEFTSLKEQFFYNINIYKELQDNDLKINLKKKEELIAKAKELESETTIRNLELSLRQLQREWGDIGPSPKETYQEMGDAFFGELRKNYDKIQAHYDSIKGEMAENLAKKQAVVEEVKRLLEMEITHHATWVKKTEEIKAVQTKWKTIGYAQKKENEEVWQQFRGLCDLFFDKKKAYYETRNISLKENLVKKEELIEKAKELQESTEWKKTTAAYIDLQNKWKTAGATFQKEEQKLWQKFRAACDTYFNTKKDHFKEQDAAQDENLIEKKKVLADIQAYKLTDKQGEDVKILKELSAKWNNIGYVPRKNVDEISGAYKAALDEKYTVLKVAREDASVANYGTRVDRLKGTADGENQMRKDKHLLKDKLERLQQKVNQYENNIGFFGHSKGAEALKKDVEKMLEIAKREIGEIRKKMRLLD
ncbi:MAG TPA: DUF349 domain-containing protein [Flavobacteriales bacterium]|nr:DUF349 domain-containing protein [Flavobacteriales bacterium]